MRNRALFTAATAVAALSLVSGSALAQDPPARLVPSLNLRNFRPSTDPAAGIYLEPADSPGTGEWAAGLWFQYAYQPITLRDAKTDDVAFKVIAHQVTADVTAMVGIANRVSLGLDLPVAIYQTGDEPTAASQRAMGETFLPAQAIGDLGVIGKLTLIRPTAGNLGGFALALHERFTLPTGDEASFLGEGSVTSTTRLLAEYRLVALSIHAAAGVKLRAEQEDFACGALANIDDCTSRFGHELPYGLGVAFRPQILGIDPKGRWTWYLDMHGHLPIAPIGPFQSTAASSLQLGLGARVALRDLSLFAGVETALLGGVGDAPVRGLLSAAWAPRSHDKDKDGVEDDQDKCADLAEDKDGFQDDDGCPEFDNDDDGVNDDADKCATQKEDEDGFQDNDGCPDPDNDGDSIPDVKDACPNEAGVTNEDPKKNGCPNRDPDGDGVVGEADKCPEQAEDKDGFQDEDGCADLDNDGDGIADPDDKCPDVKGVASQLVGQNGCPDPDQDTFAGEGDKCVDQAETFNGVDDEDGCPDEDAKKKGKPLVAVVDAKGRALEIAAPIKFTAANEVDPASLPVVRAVAATLLAHPDWSVKVGVRPSPKGGEAEATARAGALATSIRGFTKRAQAAEAAGWEAVKAAPRAAALGVGVVLVTPGEPAGAKDATGAVKKDKAPAAATKPASGPAAPKAPAKPAAPKKP